MGMIIDDGDQFPSEYSTGHKLIRVHLKDGVATGEYASSGFEQPCSAATHPR
jgi:hypothetical protein